MPPAAVPIVAVGPVAAATMLYRENGFLHLVAIVKASFSFEPDGPMSITTPEPICTREVHRMNNPTRSVTATSDLVPRLPGADVVVLGQAHAPGGSATHVTVRLAVGRGDAALLDKSVAVVGDRKGAEIKPFRSIPLVYEKAFGGPGHRENPLGTGVLSGDTPPNLLDPRGGQSTIGLGPISRSWPARSSLITADVRAGLDGPVAEVPPGFDFRYFHAAPADQRLAHLIGDEWVILENMHPARAALRLSLPGAQAMVRVVGRDGARVFSLRADTLRLDVDAGRCTLVWRNGFRVQDVDLAAMRLFGAVALPGEHVAWPEAALAEPDAPELASLPLPAPARSPHGRATASGTMVLEDREPSASFGSTMEVSDDDIEVVHVDEPIPDFSSTAVLAGTLPPTTTPLPPGFTGPAAAPPLVVMGDARRAANEATVDLDSELGRADGPVVPFAGGLSPGHPAPPIGAPSPIPGSPWDPDRVHAIPAEDAPTFDVTASDMSGTLVPVAPPPRVQVVETRTVAFPDEPPPVTAAPADDAPPAEEAAAPTQAQTVPVSQPPSEQVVFSEPAAAGDPYGQALRDVTGAEPPKPEPRQKPAEPLPSVRETLYKRFKKG